MTELEKIFLTSFLTVLVGVVVFVIGQLLSRFLIEPVHTLKLTIGEVRYNLAFYAQEIMTPASRTEQRSDAARAALLKSSCDLQRHAEAIPVYGFCRCLFAIPKHKAVADAAKWLRGLTTYLHETGEKANSHVSEVQSRIDRIEKTLNISALAES